MPTLKPDPVLAGADAFKHPTQEMIKDWEALPAVQSKLHPVNPYGKLDDNP